LVCADERDGQIDLAQNILCVSPGIRAWKKVRDDTSLLITALVGLGEVQFRLGEQAPKVLIVRCRHGGYGPQPIALAPPPDPITGWAVTVVHLTGAIAGCDIGAREVNVFDPGNSLGEPIVFRARGQPRRRERRSKLWLVFPP
jgi:hypothetical protein